MRWTCKNTRYTRSKGLCTAFTMFMITGPSGAWLAHSKTDRLGRWCGRIQVAMGGVQTKRGGGAKGGIGSSRQAVMQQLLLKLSLHNPTKTHTHAHITSQRHLHTHTHTNTQPHKDTYTHTNPQRHTYKHTDTHTNISLLSHSSLSVSFL